MTVAEWRQRREELDYMAAPVPSTLALLLSRLRLQTASPKTTSCVIESISPWGGGGAAGHGVASQLINTEKDKCSVIMTEATFLEKTRAGSQAAFGILMLSQKKL